VQRSPNETHFSTDCYLDFTPKPLFQRGLHLETTMPSISNTHDKHTLETYKVSVTALESVFFLFSHKALHSLAVEGDESCPVSTLQGNAVRYYHPATSIARKRSSSRCDVMGGCKRSRHLGKSYRDQKSTIHGSHASTADQTGNGKNRLKPHVAHT
jgi:hypothetical protein